jgi:hypothetical protein
MAKSLNIKAKSYPLVLLYNYNKSEPSFALHTVFNSSNEISYETLRKIALAPEKPSLTDLIFSS